MMVIFALRICLAQWFVELDGCSAQPREYVEAGELASQAGGQRFLTDSRVGFGNRGIGWEAYPTEDDRTEAPATFPKQS